MDSSAHRRGDDVADGDDPLSAAARAERRWGLDRVLLTHGPEGAPPDLARVLQRALRHLPVVMLHDRVLPDGAVVAGLAVGPGGVTVVAGCALPVAPLSVERLHGIFGARAELLRDGDRADRTALLGPVRAHVAAVRDVIADMAPVEGALCLDASSLHPLLVDGITIGDARAIATLAARDGDLRDYELAALVDLLDAALPPALPR